MKKRVLTILIAANLALIWGNSMLTGLSSEAVSGGILALLVRFLPVLLTEAGHTLLRKAAHFPNSPCWACSTAADIGW